MANKFWGKLVNAALPGQPYNQYTGRWNGTALRNSLISGVADQVIPGGGNIAQAFLNRSPAMQAWNAGNEGYANIAQQLGRRPDVSGYRPVVDDVQTSPGIDPANMQLQYGGADPVPGGASGALAQMVAGRGGYSRNNGPIGFQSGGHGMMGDNARHWGATGYTNDASGEVAAGFGVGAGNSGFANFQTGTDVRGRKYER